MKIIKAEDVPSAPIVQEETKAPKIDKKKVAELQEKFDVLQSQLTNKEYEVLLNEEQTTFLFDVAYESIQWKGYESYAISETYDVFQSHVKEGKLNAKVKVEIVEAIFHFLKNYIGTGVKNARLVRQLCDQFALTITEINKDRQTMRDLSLELVSTEQGIPVEQLLHRLEQENASRQG